MSRPARAPRPRLRARPSARTRPVSRTRPAARTRPSARTRRRGGDRGQAAIEFIGFLPLLLLIALAGVQLGLVAYTAVQSGTAARAAARTASQDAGESPAAAGREAISSWLADGAAFAQDTPDGEVTVTATLRIPSVIPGVDLGSVQRSSTMPRADD